MQHETHHEGLSHSLGLSHTSALSVLQEIALANVWSNEYFFKVTARVDELHGSHRMRNACCHEASSASVLLV